MAGVIVRSMDAMVAKSSVHDSTIPNPKTMPFHSMMEVLITLLKE
jgi:hypothetical protein